MRTLKKVLALTVVLATLLSISSFAAFSDEESIDESFVDAVNLLGALNVMTGDTEGTFRPNDTIMRAEAAKMIYVIRNGGVDDQAAGWTGMSTFSDVPSGAWYEGYVNYCASLGIIAGVGNGLFNPNGAVTGVELAKMLLVVADYKPDIEGYTGAGWNLNVIRDAQTAGMFKGYTLAYSAAATRQQAAQLFSNAILETQIAVYIGDTRVNDLAAITNTDTIGGRFFGLFTRTGILTNVPHVTLPVDVATSPGNNNNTVVHYDTLTANGTSDLNANNSLAQISSFGNNAWDDALFEFEADPDLLYQEVDVIFREDTDDPGVLSRDSKVYAVLPTGNTYVYETTMDAITIELDDDSMDVDYDAGAAYNPVTIQFEGFNGGRAKVLPENYQLAVVTNLYEGKTLRISGMGTHTAEWDRDVYLVDKADVEFLATTSTAPVRLIDYDRDGDLDIAFVTTPYYGTVSSYNADRFEFTTDTVIDGDNITTGRREENFERFTFEDDVEKDDVIAVTIDVLSGEMLYNVALVEPTVGELTYVYSTGPDNEVVIGGETYGFYGLLFGGEYLADMDPVLEANAYHGDLGSEVTVYTDGKYIVSAYVEPATLGTGFAFVKNYNPQGNSFDLMPDDSKALLLELVLPNGDTVVKEYDREEVSSDSAAFYEDDELVQNGAATQTLKDMLGNIVEYSSDGDYVAFRKTHKTATNDADLAPMYYNDGVDVFEFNSTTGLFRVKNTNTAVDVNENSVFFLPTYKDGVTKDKLDRGDITKVAVINGNELRGMPTITTADTADTVMQLVSSLQAGVRTVAYAALDAGSTVSDTGVFAYALTNDWDKDDGEEDERQVRAVLSDSDSDEGAVINLDNEDILANKVYRATRNSDGTYTLDEITNGEIVDGATMMLGSIRGRNGNNVTIEDAKSGSNVYSVTNDTVVFVVDIDARGSMTRINLGDVNDLSEAAEIKGAPNTYYNNVLFEYDANNELSVVYVEAVGMDVEPLINYRSVSSLTVEAPVLTAGMDRATAEAAVLAAVEKALPNHGGITYTNWKAAGVAFNWGTNVANGTEYSVDVTVQNLVPSQRSTPVKGNTSTFCPVDYR